MKNVFFLMAFLVIFQVNAFTGTSVFGASQVSINITTLCGAPYRLLAGRILATELFVGQGSLHSFVSK